MKLSNFSLLLLTVSILNTVYFYRTEDSFESRTKQYREDKKKIDQASAQGETAEGYSFTLSDLLN